MKLQYMLEEFIYIDVCICVVVVSSTDSISAHVWLQQGSEWRNNWNLEVCRVVTLLTGYADFWHGTLSSGVTHCNFLYKMTHLHSFIMTFQTHRGFWLCGVPYALYLLCDVNDKIHCWEYQEICLRGGKQFRWTAGVYRDCFTNKQNLEVNK